MHTPSIDNCDKFCELADVGTNCGWMLLPPVIKANDISNIGTVHEDGENIS